MYETLTNAIVILFSTLFVVVLLFQMARKDFDDLFKVISVELSAVTDQVTVSVEVDLELPRGFIAKIHKIIFIMKVSGAASVSVGASETVMQAVVLRDPDDITTNLMPANETQHDVIAEAVWAFHAMRLTVDSEVKIDPHSPGQQIIDFDNVNMDVITARNLRFNVVKNDLAAPVDTQPILRCNIYYTLERVTDIDILNLLDIL